MTENTKSPSSEESTSNPVTKDTPIEELFGPVRYEYKEALQCKGVLVDMSPEDFVDLMHHQFLQIALCPLGMQIGSVRDSAFQKAFAQQAVLAAFFGSVADLCALKPTLYERYPVANGFQQGCQKIIPLLEEGKFGRPLYFR